MVMPYLPSELVEEILSWVPATSLVKLLSTCKQWNALLKDQRFTEKQLRRAPKQPQILMLKEYRFFPTRVDVNVVPPSIELKDALSLKDPHSNKPSKQVRIAEVYHCDGLLLCITRDSGLVVWNPCLGETRWIQHKNGYKVSCRFALGYESNRFDIRSYKILMFFRGKPDEFEIYEFTTNTWRVVNAPSGFIRAKYHGVCLRGNAYWLHVDDNADYHFLRFDFTRERFTSFCLPQSPSRRYMALSVVREKQLSVLSYKKSGHDVVEMWEVEMWVTNEIDTKAEEEEELSWRKSFAVGKNRIRVNGIDCYTSLLIDEEKKVALCCNLSGLCSSNLNVVYTMGEDDDEYYTEIPYIEKQWLLCHGEDERAWRPFFFSYVPSLVQIQPKYISN
ncbi:unnamed protein product [Microthlaspi erraticum]|uniref:F-box domain-containing protein n=1 Tax=Microthlaspi erraticum TaxID=1685480 RepID=A0A6D2IRE2_9BRAS|nr:unnamed protein product [Microthlaspi erraticum]